MKAGAEIYIVEDFIKQNYHKNYTLIILDTTSDNIVDIECSVEEIPEIVSFIYQLEHAMPISFIAEDCDSESYVIGMNFKKRRIIPGIYWFEDGALVPILLM